MRVRSLLGIATLLLLLHQPMWLQAAETNCMQLTDPSQADECFSNMRRKWQEADAQRRAEAKRRAAANNQTNCMELSDGNQVPGCLWNNIQKLREENKRLRADVTGLRVENQSLQNEVTNLSRGDGHLRNDVKQLTQKINTVQATTDKLNTPAIRVCQRCGPKKYSCTRQEAAQKCDSMGMRLCTLGELGAYAEAGLMSCCWGWLGDPSSPFNRKRGVVAFIMGSSTTTGHSRGCDGDPGGLRIDYNRDHANKVAAHCCRK
ncbi:hypothetical protein TI05_07345 [Achromatium sp. WMS3]|nr:hypothetical protein TI05_07345 [Achromatium sp. WMS3]